MILTRRDHSFLIQKQSTWGTPVGDAGNFIELNLSKDVEIDRDVKVREYFGHHRTRETLYEEITTDEKGAMPKFQLEGVCKKLEIPLFLYAFYQQVTEAGSSPYGKTYTPHNSQPDLTSGAGFFFTFVSRHRNNSRSLKLTDCVVSNLVWKLTPDDYMMFTADCVARKATIINSNITGGTVTLNPATFYHLNDFDRFTIDFGAGAVSPRLVDFELRHSQDVIGAGPDGSGNVADIGLVNRKIEFVATCLDDANLQTAYTNEATNVPVSVRLGIGNATAGSVDGDLDFAFTAKLGTPEKVRLNFDDALGYKIAGTICTTASATASITEIIATGADEAW